jgi:phage tail-like protein
MSAGQRFASTQRHDPYRDFNYRVSIVGRRQIYHAAFTQISGIKAIIDYAEQTEGGNNGSAYQIAEAARFEPVQLLRGMSEDMSIVDAFGSIHDPNVGVNNRDKYTVTITLMDRDGKTPVREFVLYEAWFSGFETSDFNALGGGVFLEKLIVSYEDLGITKRS